MHYTMEGIEEIVTELEDFVDEVQTKIDGAFEIAEGLTKETDYSVLLDIFKDMEKTYNENVIQSVKAEITKWSEEDGNFVWSMDVIKESEGRAIAEQLQQRVLDKVQEIKEINIFEGMTTGGSPRIESESIKQKIEEIISNQIHPLEETVEEHVESIKSKAEDNDAAKTFISVVVRFGQSTKEFMKTLMDKINEKLGEALEKMGVQLDTAMESNRSADDKYLQSVMDELEDSLSSLDGLFD